jgi:hypothetical protein
MKSLLLGLLIVAVLALGTTPADAHNDATVHFTNASRVCVWLTVDTGSAFSSYTAVKYGFVKPGERVVWTFGQMADVKFRAQPRKTAECSGDRSADVSIYKGGFIASYKVAYAENGTEKNIYFSQ